MFSGHIYIICVYLKKTLYKNYFFLWSHRNRLNDYSVKNKIHRQVESSNVHAVFYRVPVCSVSFLSGARYRQSIV